ncbi:MAG TPA: DUF1735 domain-containing protein [Chitinophaga sp.]|uniref:BT_3987 domain-containing protein n=1 Tax=Chitinophaga sp. TaxID=1869181 RepID=UPI002B5140F9|nr:DUF1735 domain-containing protein [Chitinophaga sp.]HVI45636.1 DUF1735 domain-containing protein [Chitinophaga sp.]
MKKHHIAIQIPVYFSLLVCFFTGCKKNDDQPKELVAFLSPDFQPDNSFNFSAVITRTPNGSVGDSSITLPPMVRLTRPVSAAVKVSIDVDTSLVSAYNKQHNTAYKAAPEGAYKIELMGGVTIPAGETGNKDSMRIVLLQPNIFAGADQYLIPLRLKNADNGVSISTRVGALFIILKASIGWRNINDALTTPTGTVIDRKMPQWKIASTSGEWFGDAAAVLDGDFTTAWMTYMDGKPPAASLAVDMGAANTLKAITVTPGYVYGSDYNSSTIQVLTSMDNATWTDQGIYNGPAFGGSDTSPDTRALNFFAPVSARYLKLVFTGGSGFAGVSELNAYR